MTLLFADGFDHYATTDVTKKWNLVYNTTNPAITSSVGRRGSGAYVATSFHGTVKTLPSSSATMILGIAFKPSAFQGYTIFSFAEGSTLHLSVVLETSGKISIKRGIYNGTNLATSATTLSTGTWYYLELKATINDTTGATELRINGVADANLTLTGVDTRNGGTSGVVDTIAIGQYTSGIGSFGSYDDLYVCDSSGSTNNNFLGDVRIDTLLPTGDGNYTQFTPSTGSSHYALVDESTPNTTDYNSDATSGDRDSYTFPDLTALVSQTVYAVQINAAALKSDSGSRSLGTMSRLSGTDKDGSGAALGTSQVYVREIQETDPASAAWTEANVNAAEFGVKVTA